MLHDALDNWITFNSLLPDFLIERALSVLIELPCHFTAMVPKLAFEISFSLTHHHQRDSLSLMISFQRASLLVIIFLFMLRLFISIEFPANAIIVLCVLPAVAFHRSTTIQRAERRNSVIKMEFLLHFSTNCLP